LKHEFPLVDIIPEVVGFYRTYEELKHIEMFGNVEMEDAFLSYL